MIANVIAWANTKGGVGKTTSIMLTAGTRRNRICQPLH